MKFPRDNVSRSAQMFLKKKMTQFDCLFFTCKHMSRHIDLHFKSEIKAKRKENKISF